MTSFRLTTLIAVILAGTAAAVEAQTDVEYARVGSLSLRLDAYPPSHAAPLPAPAVVLVHGGAWIKGDRRINVEPLIAPLTQAGFAVFSISYRFAPDYLYPAAVEDVRGAVRFIRANAARFAIDPARVALVGESAGAQLAALAALDAEPQSAVQAVVSLYGPMDFVRLADTSRAVPEGLMRAAQDSILGTLLLGGLRSMSPITFVHPGMPPFLFVHGTADSIVPAEQSARMCEAIKAAGAACDLHTVQGGGHGLLEWERDPAQSSYKAQLVEWLRARLRS